MNKELTIRLMTLIKLIQLQNFEAAYALVTSGLDDDSLVFGIAALHDIDRIEAGVAYDMLMLE